MYRLRGKSLPLILFLESIRIWLLFSSLHKVTSKSVSNYHKNGFAPIPSLPGTIANSIEYEDGLLQNNTTTEPSCSTGSGREARFYSMRSSWTKFNVYIDPSYGDNARTMIINGVNRLAQVVSCIQFQVYPKNTTPTGDYVHIISGGDNICESVVGKSGGRQILTLGRNCLTMDIICHELMHALGVEHEQNRPDRDNYVTINWKNIKPGMERNFMKSTSYDVATYGVPYNYNSIMHYRSTDFSNNGQPTIVAKDGGSIGPRGLQSTDELKLRRMYGCQ